MTKWLLPTLSEILSQEQNFLTGAVENSWNQTLPALLCPQTLEDQRTKAEQEWCGAIAALGQLLEQLKPSDSQADSQSDFHKYQGIILCGPLPLFSHPDLLKHLHNWIFVPDLLTNFVGHPLHLLPAQGQTPTEAASAFLPLLPLLNNDPLALEQFCVVLTHSFSLVLVLGENNQKLPHFQFSFNPEIVWQAWEALQTRVRLTNGSQADRLQTQAQPFPPKAPDYRLVSQFSRSLLAHLPTVEASLSEPFIPTVQNRAASASANLPQATEETVERADLQLLQAIAHEVRTPLATIRTLTRLLLKRRDLAPEVLKRLEVIDHECTEQIDRFGLIFTAAELETDVHHRPCHLAATSLNRVFEASIPRWQKQASRRGLVLKVGLPQQMPTVVIDPTMLDQALTGLIERFTRHLPGGSHIEIKVSLAGDQLKLQLQSQVNTPENKPTAPASFQNTNPFSSRFQSLGHLLLFQPETGSLSLNLDVTKNLFQALGGKLKIRERSQRGEVLTIFLPLDVKALGTNSA